MNKKTILLLFPLLALALTSCGEQIDWKTNPLIYQYDELEFHENFNILQLTDIHWNVNSSTASSKGYLDKVLKEADRKIKADHGETAQIDLVELTGDQFMLANTYHVKTFVDYFETKAVEYGFKYAIIWGNHDRHGLYSPNWLADQYRNASHCIYIEPEDNLYGRSNFVINLKQAGVTFWQIYNLDSGASFSESPLSIGRNYDYIRKDQVEWFKEQRGLQPSANAIAYYHIPQQDNLEAWNLNHDGDSTNDTKNKFFKLEGFDDAGKEEYKSEFIEEASHLGLKAAFMGHAHNVDWTVEYKNVVIGLGVKTGTELYFAHIDGSSTDENMKEGFNSIRSSVTPAMADDEKFDLIGASLVTLQNSTDFALEHLYLNEREGAANGYVSWWVKW